MPLGSRSERQDDLFLTSFSASSTCLEGTTCRRDFIQQREGPWRRPVPEICCWNRLSPVRE